MATKDNNCNKALFIEQMAKQRPILTEEEINNFCTFEEIIAEAKTMFDAEIDRIWQEHDSHKHK